MLSRQSQFFNMLESSTTCLLPLAIALAKDISIFYGNSRQLSYVLIPVATVSYYTSLHVTSVCFKE